MPQVKKIRDLNQLIFTHVGIIRNWWKTNYSVLVNWWKTINQLNIGIHNLKNCTENAFKGINGNHVLCCEHSLRYIYLHLAGLLAEMPCVGVSLYMFSKLREEIVQERRVALGPNLLDFYHFWWHIWALDKGQRTIGDLWEGRKISVSTGEWWQWDRQSDLWGKTLHWRFIVLAGWSEFGLKQMRKGEVHEHFTSS